MDPLLTTHLALSAASILVCLAVAVSVLWKDRRSLVHRVFALGLLLLALEEVLSAWAIQAVFPGDALLRQRVRWTVASLLPGVWLLFAVSFARANEADFRRKWRIPLILSFAVPPLLVLLGNGNLFGSSLQLQPETALWIYPLGSAGKLFFSAFLVAAVAILANLEWTLLASTGRMRWQIKFIAFGLGALFAIRIYTTSQVLLYSALDPQLELVRSGGLLLAGLLCLVGLTRSQPVFPQVYLSKSFVAGSITVVAVGVYLLIVAVLARVVQAWDPGRMLILDAFLVFLALCVLAVLLLSDRLRLKLDHFVTLHLKRPHYDYRQVWTDFTRHTSLLRDEKELGRAIVQVLSKTLGVLSVSLWTRTSDGRLVLTASTSEGHEDDENHTVSLAVGDRDLGRLVLGYRTAKEPYSVEDLNLIQTIADQTASALLGLRMEEQMRRNQELESFQSMSAFFAHDLKNLASKLSLTVQNLPSHFDDPEFRDYAIRTVSNSVSRINETCHRLSEIRKEIELHLVETDINEVVQAVLTDSRLCFASPVAQDLRPLPSIRLDGEQISKVLVNLLMNAQQAAGAQAEIRVSTGKENGHAVVAVEDNGPGMSPEFIRNCLFRPFQTTKKEGMGIGLFHSKMIVESHHGRIEVESQEGQGTTFRIFLPLSAFSASSAVNRK
jgi:signal transduction histidine kinase